jgi:hypothetical protein
MGGAARAAEGIVDGIAGLTGISKPKVASCTAEAFAGVPSL